MRNPIITLLTDFGIRDHYVASLKGVILGINPRCSLIDISHQVSPQDIIEGAILLANVFSYFPKGTIHLAIVDPGVGSQRKPILLKTKNYYFIGPDNGIFTKVAEKDIVNYGIELTNKKYFLKDISKTFHGRDIFAPVAGYLSLGVKPEVFGKKINEWVKIGFKEPIIEGNKLIGEIIYIDNFGNLISNIDQNRFKNFIMSFRFNIKIGKKSISEIKNGYWEGREGEIIALFGSSGYLEISVNHGSAQKRLKVNRGDYILVERS